MSSTIGSSTSGANLLSSILATGSPPTLSPPASTTDAPDLAVAGLASGMNWETVIAELANAERAPETQWESQISSLDTQNSAYTTISGDLVTLQTDAEALQSSSLYTSTAVQSSNSAVATANSDSGATLGNYTFDISQLATAAQLNGSTGIAQAISPNGNLSSVTIGTAGFATPVTPGTFTVNGAQVSIATTYSLQQVFNNIATATNNTVTASYNSTTDEITLASNNNSPVVLGSAADTSNFLQVAQLFNNGTDSVTSTSALGHVQLGGTMSDADLSTPITDGGNGQGEFTINGVAINYNASTESIADVLSSINSSAAGVTANYDSINNSFTLTNNTTGDVGISVKDVTGNFLQATGLSSGTLQSGTNLLYTLDGGARQLVSESNTITPASSSISGLAVTASQTGSATVSVTSDTSAITSAIQQFVTDYNTAQTAISNDQEVTVSSSGAITPGVLTGDLTASGMATSLRSLVTGAVPGLSGAVSMLSDLGIQGNGQNNTLSVDTSTLDSVVAANLSSVQTLFADPTNGLATQMNNYITNATGANGTITDHQASLNQQVTALNSQISNLETKITSDTATWTSEFTAMETAESQTNQELTYLSEQITSGSL
ncbi:MAG: flagellar filament capping protein FliD [Verrucomicrobiota bacterium]